MLAKSPLTKKYDLSSVIDIGSGAAPLGGEVIEEFEALWPEGDRKMKARLLARYLVTNTDVSAARLGHDRSNLLPSRMGPQSRIASQFRRRTKPKLQGEDHGYRWKKRSTSR
jgi:hypothetical protein